MQTLHPSVTLKVICTTDIHGRFFPSHPSSGGLSCVYDYLCGLREEWEGRLVLLDGGDMLQGDPFTYYYNELSTCGPHPVACMMNRMDYDAACPGNHDIEAGHTVYDRWAADCRFPVLAANLIDERTREPYFRPYAVIERCGLRIAVIGLITKAFPCWVLRSQWTGICVEDMVASARRWMAHVEETEHPDVVIGLFHSGLEGGMTQPGYEENVTLGLLKQTTGFDAVFFGHDHGRCLQTVTDAGGKSVPVINPAAYGQWVGELTVSVWKDAERRVFDKHVEAGLVDVRGRRGDKAREFEDAFREERESVARYTGEWVALSDVEISSRDAYFGPSAFVDLIHECQLQQSGADVSFAAPVTFDTSLPQGNIRVGDVFNLYRFENKLCTLKLSGREIVGALERSYALWTRRMRRPTDNVLLLQPSDRTRGRYSFVHPVYDFDSAAGLRYSVDVTRPYGSKITVECMTGGKPFLPDATYTVVTNSYRATGGGELFTIGCGLTPEQLSSRIVRVSPYDLRYYLIGMLRRQRLLLPGRCSDWRFVPEEWVREALERDRLRLFPDTISCSVP
ncbi:MAG: 5'-nucleotidase C-terminal domain-containing protein [Clostridium sp.]|nr:5'-nucleotidase C-terminal domain-containing protein [Clostridium sp.]